MNVKNTTVLMLLSLVLAGCNTIEGAGEDIGRGGEALKRVAKKIGGSSS